MGSFYTTFPELTSPDFSGVGGLPSTKTDENLRQSNPQPESGIFSAAPSDIKSPSSSCSHSSGSSICCSIGVKQHTTTNNGLVSGDPLMVEDPGGVLKRTHSDVELHALNRDETKLLNPFQFHVLHLALQPLDLILQFNGYLEEIRIIGSSSFLESLDDSQINKIVSNVVCGFSKE
ncbi:PROTEIN NLP8 [Salix koriyanagi]|uniref:PROTEIN NLP8 n=1 Tax=Salix koriyanagi TaxID=2511006 RepID=A0A9Q0UZR6_9ROSI|nr:PROTEIN NLP8 [Salix koriyanagi]